MEVWKTAYAPGCLVDAGWFGRPPSPCTTMYVGLVSVSAGGIDSQSNPSSEPHCNINQKKQSQNALRIPLRIPLRAECRLYTESGEIG